MIKELSLSEEWREKQNWLSGDFVKMYAFTVEFDMTV